MPQGATPGSVLFASKYTFNLKFWRPGAYSESATTGRDAWQRWATVLRTGSVTLVKGQRI